MFHFTYITTLKGSDKYYIGRHSTNKIEDNYYGSGKWVRSIKDKSRLERRILQMFETFEELILAEERLLNENVGRNGCMNFNNNPVGFASGSLNPNTSPEARAKNSRRMKGNNNGSLRTDKSKQDVRERMKHDNPAKRPEVREKISKNVSQARKGIKYSEEGRRKLSESRKLEYANGTRIPHNKGKPAYNRGIPHSVETRDKMSRIRKERYPTLDEATREKMRGPRGFKITNGVKESICKGDIPEGWYRGRVTVQCVHCKEFFTKPNIKKHIKAKHSS